MSTVHPLLLGYPSLLDTVCPLLEGRYLSVCNWIVAINCWLLYVRVLFGGLCLLSIRYYLGILHYWIQSVHYCWVGIVHFTV